ncbi:MAG: NifU family protein [Mycobacterium sp.]|nr:NifU family protein [Mycobacterium sp.]
MIGLHAERVSGEPQAVRWVMLPPGALPAGRVRTAPGRLGEMFADETLSAGLVEHTAVWLWLRDELSWSTVGPQVAKALRAALEHPGDWVIDPDPGEVLFRVTNDLLDGSVGDFIRSHGGSVAAERAGDDVAVTLGGACARCAAADHTLRGRLLEGLRGRCPDLVASGPDTEGLTLRLHP